MRKTNDPSPRTRSRRAAFTLIETLVAGGLSGIILAAVLSSFVYLGRAGVGLQHYSDMASQSRVMLQQFGQDVRQATAATWTDADTLVLTVDGTAVTYDYNAGAKNCSRTTGGQPRVLVRGISSIQFRAFDINGQVLNLAANLAAANGATKMIQLEIDMARSSQSLGSATGEVISARFVLRNKKVS